MNIYEKLQTARIELQESSLKKSGQNKFAGYDYFELGDFMPKINKLMLEYKMIGVVRFNNELATLTVINTEKPEETIEFTSPMSSASLKGCHDVQNLGAVQTYLRRYLYVNAFEIVEHDALDSTTGKNDTPKGNTKGQSNKPATGQNKPPEKQFDNKASTEADSMLCADCGRPVNEAVKMFCEKKNYDNTYCVDCQKKHRPAKSA